MKGCGKKTTKKISVKLNLLEYPRVCGHLSGNMKHVNLNTFNISLVVLADDSQRGLTSLTDYWAELSMHTRQGNIQRQAI